MRIGSHAFALRSVEMCPGQVAATSEARRPALDRTPVRLGATKGVDPDDLPRVRAKLVDVAGRDLIAVADAANVGGKRLKHGERPRPEAVGPLEIAGAVGCGIVGNASARSAGMIGRVGAHDQSTRVAIALPDRV